MTEPALPWAHRVVSDADAVQLQAETEQSLLQVEQADDDHFLTLETAGVSVGGRIEVNWEIEPGEGEAYFRWWGATIVGPSIQKDSKRPDAPVYELLYDTHDVFDQERGHIVFTSEHTLHQLDQTDELSWRREGDTWNDGDEEDEGTEAEEEQAADGEALLTMDDLRRISSQALGGRNLEDLEMEALQSLEPSKRRAVAAGYRDMMDSFVSYLQNLLDGESGGNIVTAEHVRAFFESMRKKRRTS